jgi:hypothetical protein
VDDLANSLRAKGFRVSLGAKTREAYFTVSSREVVLDEPGLMKAFEYSSATRADEDAAVVTPEGQPTPLVMFGWIDVPHFYKSGRLIVLFIGCNGHTLEALENLLGRPFAGGTCKDVLQ